MELRSGRLRSFTGFSREELCLRQIAYTTHDAFSDRRLGDGYLNCGNGGRSGWLIPSWYHESMNPRLAGRQPL